MSQAELWTNAQEVWAKIHKNWPKNTKKAHDRKAEEFVDWCEDRGFPDGFMLEIGAVVMAAMDLWRQQKGLGMNTHSSPGGDSVWAFIKALKQEEMAWQKAGYAEKGRDSPA
ncbi:hypothetical protein B0T25DRAFT_571196 [Lasiosphaeria hispida]|uniref:Uncharacterized protein n=1 Tax=Lasiosphaeria hispida TaxID=260671 RepID=A0AAJ0HAN1_9PEZI|nr:hypothetical protein B0T25DRAFT_571196 [Lasiosphaeria hispida]